MGQPAAFNGVNITTRLLENQKRCIRQLAKRDIESIVAVLCGEVQLDPKTDGLDFFLRRLGRYEDRLAELSGILDGRKEEK